MPVEIGASQARKPALRAVLILVAIGALAYFTAGLWLPALGYALIHDDGPAKADWFVRATSRL